MPALDHVDRRVEHAVTRLGNRSIHGERAGQGYARAAFGQNPIPGIADPHVFHSGIGCQLGNEGFQGRHVGGEHGVLGQIGEQLCGNQGPLLKLVLVRGFQMAEHAADENGQENRFYQGNADNRLKAKGHVSSPAEPTHREGRSEGRERRPNRNLPPIRSRRN